MKNIQRCKHLKKNTFYCTTRIKHLKFIHLLCTFLCSASFGSWGRLAGCFALSWGSSLRHLWGLHGPWFGWRGGFFCILFTTWLFCHRSFFQCRSSRLIFLWLLLWLGFLLGPHFEVAKEHFCKPERKNNNKVLHSVKKKKKEKKSTNILTCGWSFSLIGDFFVLPPFKKERHLASFTPPPPRMSNVNSSRIHSTFFTAYLGALFMWLGFFLHVGICVLTLVLSLLKLWRELYHMNRNQLKYFKIPIRDV